VPTPPEEKNLQTTSFVVHATKGVIRDQRTRRKAIALLLALAVLLLLLGGTVLAPWLNPREHLLGALIFWLACIWLTLTATLLAIFDLLAVRLAAKRVERALREQIKSDAARSSPSRTGISNE
jgi:membrane protein implicated in regulation of membrane protease activity